MKTIKSKISDNHQLIDLKKNIEIGESKFLTTNQGLRILHFINSLKVGEQGSTFLENFQLREIIPHIRERVIGMLTKVDKNLAANIALKWGIAVPESENYLNQNIPADDDQIYFQPTDVQPELKFQKR